ncbi:hypothetical protein GUJ93_ZPchr0010g7635 [Zizania palustris]|uniref:Uncharacterized protein n=1 Tax=Zizania palustris TaxID=103762 RepID=A0A8J5WCK6_ZIZPA|nr:hypothetical protein GUJ93_ZPchr0010g7635 [Zizania palustris]
MDGLVAPSPSHSGATSGGGASHRKRKLPPSSLSDATADEDDDTTAPSSPSTSPSSPSRPSSPSSSHSDDDDDSLHTFTAARLDGAPASSSGRPPKPDSSSVSAAAAAAAAAPKTEAVSAAAGDGKEDPKGLFTDNIQTSGAHSAREESLKREEDAGRLKFLCNSNDGVDEHMIWLVGLKNIFARQLPNMPKEYIVRLVMDRTHKSMMVIRNNIVLEVLLTALMQDNNAVGYFVKQGFTKVITLDKERWQG